MNKKKNKELSRTEFFKYWSKNAGLDLETIKKLGFEPIPCDCKRKFCKGWTMSYGRN